MTDLYLARAWADVRTPAEAEHSACALQETRSPRDFFGVDETVPYVVRVRERGGRCILTLTPAPARSASVAACEEQLR